MTPADPQRLADNADLLALILEETAETEWLRTYRPVRTPAELLAPGPTATEPVPKPPKATEWHHLHRPSISISGTCWLAFMGVIVLGMAVTPILRL